MSPPSEWVPRETYHRGRKWGQGALAGLAVGLSIVYACLRWRPFRVEISGPSMAPELVPGDWALAVEARRLHTGDIVVVGHPSRAELEMVKRVVAGPDQPAPDGRVLDADEFWVEGDSGGSSTDSRHFGPVRRTDIKAKVLLVYWPPERRHLVRR